MLMGPLMLERLETFPMLLITTVISPLASMATVLHWGAKHGNAEIIKVFAGTYKVDVNGKTVFFTSNVFGLRGKCISYEAVDVSASMYTSGTCFLCFIGKRHYYSLDIKPTRNTIVEDIL
ncbi:hypothetical protein NQ317_018489 [Molorchus minor]|uniref:Uncharacterized protein n=1 Tax=Molorchus minor TaxID=1323400 RepID=A0ABQ9JWS7_9CUCU|nr:hypothetical protein NQ317_018489 [Molorchus minor]